MLDYALIDAVAAVLREGSFERAARALGVTPSAVSQRVKLIEERMGTALIVRGQPCTPTDVPLHWQVARIGAPLLDRLGLRVTEAAGRSLLG